MKYFVANWKEHMTLQQGTDWLTEFMQLVHHDATIAESLETQKYAVIICPQTTELYPLKEKIKNQNGLYLGAQTVSPYQSGNYTGENSAESLQNLADYVLLGHHERRSLFHETDEMIRKEYEVAVRCNIKPIICIETKEQWVPQDAPIVAYEPPQSIGTGLNEPVEAVLSFKNECSFGSSTAFLYGGSVHEGNAILYIKEPEISGLLIGTASLNPHSFASILRLS